MAPTILAPRDGLVNPIEIASQAAPKTSAATATRSSSAAKKATMAELDKMLDQCEQDDEDDGDGTLFGNDALPAAERNAVKKRPRKTSARNGGRRKKKR